MKENNFEPHECIILVQSTKIGTYENKVIHSINLLYKKTSLRCRTRVLKEHICSLW